MSPIARLLSLQVRFYRRFLSPLKPPTCRFTPTCSAYLLEALQIHGALKGLLLGLRRLLGCHPWGGSGPDPVPGRRDGYPGGSPGAAAGPPATGAPCEGP